MDAFTDPGEHTKNHSEKTYEASLGALQVPVFKASTPQRDLQLQPLSQGQSSSLDSYLSHISPRYRTKCFVTGKKKKPVRDPGIYIIKKFSLQKLLSCL